MFKIKKHLIDLNNLISNETIDLAESGNSLLGAFNFYNGGVKRIPLQLAYSSDDGSELPNGGPTVSDFLLSIYAFFGDDNFSQKYTLERFDEVSNQVFFRNTITDKILKVRVFLDPEKFNVGFNNNDGNSIGLNYGGFVPLIPDESGCFYLADEHNFSENSFYFILEFNCEPKFVSSFETAAEFQIGLDFKALEIGTTIPNEGGEIICVGALDGLEVSYYPDFGEYGAPSSCNRGCGREDCPYYHYEEIPS